MSENEAIIKIIAEHTREYNELSEKYNRLGTEHGKLVNEFVDLKILNGQLTRENKEYKALLEVAEKVIIELRGEEE